MKELFDTVSISCSTNITTTYSTSFSMGIKLLAPRLRNPIFSIYGFVRLADEIVDSFQGYEQQKLLSQLKTDTFNAIADKISINPVLNSFQQVVHQFKIEDDLIYSFLESMEMDLDKKFYTRSLYDKYIYGSAEVVGLMCLKVFCEGDTEVYERLKHAAMKLGSAFQKVNFLRDLKADNEELGRLYFPNINLNPFTERDKITIETEINNDFQEALQGIMQLPKSSRKGVYLAYKYYQVLLKKIQLTPADHIMNSRIRVADTQKFVLLIRHSIL